MTWERVTYARERVAATQQVPYTSPYMGLILEQIKRSVERHIEETGSVIVFPPSWVEEGWAEITVRIVPVYFGHVFIGLRTIHDRADYVTVSTWAWMDVRPEHRKRLAITKVRDDMQHIDMLLAANLT
jgi:hypothetical protein